MRHIAKYHGMQPLVHAVVSAVFCYAFFNALNSAVLAGPEGAEVIHGRVSFQRNGLNTVIKASDKSIVNYKSFNIASPEAVEFVQPHSNASVLNRILSANPTHIDGTLSANGRVFFVNPAGVYIGNGAKINVNQLVASGLNISNSDFINGKYLFTGGHGSVVNRGDITAEKVHLIGKQVANYGTINCPGGYVVMAVGDRVFLGSPGNDLTVEVEVDTAPLPEPTDLDVGVRNEGTINAAGGEIVLAAAGDIYSQAISNVGTLSASVRAGEAGKVKLVAEEGKVVNSGSITATSDSGTGGTVQVLGDRVGLFDGTEIDASGSKGGGTVLVGGDYQGKGDVPTASRTYVSPDSTIKADATENGDGGKVVVWSDEATYYSGDISARGGPEGGNGGVVEVSSKESLGFHGHVDALAPKGSIGTLLLDPATIEIAGGTLDGDDSDNADDTVGAGDPDPEPGEIILDAVDPTPEDNFLLYESEIEGTDAHVTLEAADGITVSGIFTDGVTLKTDRNLTLRTRNSDAEGDGTTGIDLSGGEAFSITTQGSGDITIEAGTAPDSRIAPATLSAMSTDKGSITVAAKGDVTVDGPLTTGNVTTSKVASGGISLTSSAGAIKVNAAVTTGNATVEDGTAANTKADRAESGNIILSAGTNITGSGKLQTGNAELGEADKPGKDSAISGSIQLTSGTAGTTGEIALSDPSVLVIGTASRVGSGSGKDTTRAGSIILRSDGKIYNGTDKGSLKVKINKAGGGEANYQGLLDVTTTEDAGSVYVSSDSALRMGTFDTKDATVQTVDVTVTGDNQVLTVAEASELDVDTVTLTADRMVIDGMLTTTDRVTVRPNNTGEAIDLGSATDAAADTLELSDAELNNITAATLVIGDSDKTGAITICSDVSPTNVTNLHLVGSSTVTGTAGGVVVSGLAVQAAGTVNITNSATNVKTLAINTSTGNIQFTEADGFSVGTVDSVAGVVTGLGSVALTAMTGDVDLNAAVTGTTLVDIYAGTNVTTSALVTGGQIDIHANSDVLFDGAEGALTADNVITVDAGASIANTGSTAAETIKTTTTSGNITLTPANTTTPSTQAFVVESAGEFKLAGPMSGTAFIIYAVDNINIDGAITGTTSVDLISSTANVDVGAAIMTNGGTFTSSGVDFDNTDGTIITGGGAVDIRNTGNVTIGAALNAGAGNVDIDGDTGVAASIISGGGTITSSGTIALEASGSIGGPSAAITTAGTGTINASSTVSGDIYIENTGNVTLGTVSTKASNITINNIGNILIGSITAGESGNATINSITGSIDDAATDTVTDITAGTVNLDAATGIGATRELETSATMISADTDDGDIDIDNDHASDFTAISLTTVEGNILFSQVGGGNLEVTKASAGTGDVQITADGDVTDSGAITAKKLTINTDVGTGGAIILDLDDTHDADIVNLTSKSGWNIIYKDKDDVKVEQANAGKGNVTIIAATTIDNDAPADGVANIVGGDINLTALLGGIGQGTTLEVNAATELNADTTADGADINIDSIGDLPVGLVTAHHVGDISDPADDKYGDVTLNSTGNIDSKTDDETADIVGSTVGLKSDVGGIGTKSAVDVTALIELNADTTGDGADINIDSIGDLPVGLIIADNGAGTIGNVTLNSTGSINDAGTGNAAVDITGDILTLTARDEIGGSGELDIETTAASLDASSTTAGDIVITETDDITLTDVDTVDGDITVLAGGNIQAVSVDALGAGNVLLEGANVYVDWVFGASSITINATNPVTGEIEELGVDVSADLTTPAATLSAALSIGGLGAIETDLTVLSVHSGNGNIVIEEKDDIEIGLAEAGNGNVTISAGGDVTDTGAITAKKLTVNTDVGAGGAIILDLDAAHDADMVELTSKSGRNIVYKDKNNVKLGDILADTGNIFLEATNGGMTQQTGTTITAGGSLTLRQADALDLRAFNFDKQASTDLTLESFNGSVSVVDTANQWKSIKAAAQSGIALEGSGNITTGVLQSITENISVRSKEGNLIVNDTVKADGGGVELIADAGIIYTEGGSNDTLNVDVTGFSDGKKGVKLPHGNGKAAIFIMSKGDLKLGSEATLTAGGEYKAYDSAHDDRGSIEFQNKGDKAGDPIDVAIYVGSYDFESEAGGDVTVNSSVSMTSNGTMVVDAGNVVNSFGSKFTESPVWKDKTSRLEVVSRTTQTVDQAVDKKTLPHAVEARGDEAPSWFQGEQYVLRGKPVAEVLAKVGPVPLVPPLPAEPEDRREVEKADTEELMLWLEKEGIAPYLAEADLRTLSTDIRLIKAARRLRECTNIFKSTTSDQIDILVRILDEHVDEPEHIAQVNGKRVMVWHRNDAVMAVLSGQWAGALVEYVQTCTNEFYMPYERAANLCIGKYVDEGLVGGRAQGIISRLLNYIQESSRGLESGMSVYWTENSA